MLRLLFLLGISILLSAITEQTIVRDDIAYRNSSNWGNSALYKVMTVILVVFAGLRTRYNDTATYIAAYNTLQTEEIDYFSLKLGENPGFVLVECAMHKFNLSAQSFIMIFSVVTISLFLWFIYKYSDNLTVSIFIFITGGLYLFSFAAIKQCCAIAISLIAIDRAINRRWKGFIFWLLTAAMFHTYALLFVFVPFLFFKAWSKKTYILIAVGTTFGVTFQRLLGSILNITSLLGESYNQENFSGQGVNIFRLLVAWAPVILAFFARRSMMEDDDEQCDFFFNLTLVCSLWMLVALFGTAFYLTRVAYYFWIFQAIFIPKVLKYYQGGARSMIVGIMIIGYLLFFYYSCGINRSFDYMYSSVSFFDYISNIFN